MGLSATQKQATTGTILDAMPAHTSNLTSDPLYKELLAIGRDKKTIRADALYDCTHLLNCAEVRRRAGLDANQARLALCASEAIQVAIANIVTPTTREIAEAALCATKDFKGLKVQERIHKLEGISEKQFKYHRGLAFREIVRFLTSDISAPDSAIPLRTSQGQRQEAASDHDLRYLTRLAERAATLHYGSLAILFANALDEKLRAGDNTFRRYNFGVEGYPLKAHLFKTIVSFIYGRYPSRGPETSCFADEFLREGYEHQYLKPPVAKQLIALWKATADSTPIGPSKCDETEVGYLVLVAHDTDQIHLARGAYAQWDLWLHSIRPETLEAHLARLVTPLVTISYRFALLLSQHVRFNTPIHSRAKLMTYKAIASCYDFDEWVPLLDGPSLRHQADAYFESEGPRLTNLTQ
jgi:hypothetical protein